MARCPTCQLEYAAISDTDPCPRCVRTNVAAPMGPMAADEDPYSPDEMPGASAPAAQVGATKDPSTGSVIAGYTLQERVGDGATSAVYKAITGVGNPPVAVKVLSAEKAGDQESLERFNREGRLARRIKHPNLVRVHASGQDEQSGAHYLVMDLVDGETLDALIRRSGRLPWRQALELMYQITQAVAHLHKHGCVHRDIKPQNILVADGVAKLTDLGFVKPISEAVNDQDTLIMGTPAYMAPEQSVDARAATHVADVYALGATLYHALTGSPPFSGGTGTEIMTRIRRVEPPTPAELVPDLPDSVDSLVRWAMAKSPGDRPPDAISLCQIIERILGNPGNARSIERARQSRSETDAKMLVLVISIGLSVLTFLAYWFIVRS